MAIDGFQTVSDVFLFDAEGDRGTSQSLIGIDKSQLPVHAEITVQTPQVLNIHKTGGGQGLEGIRFDVFFVADREEYLTGKVTLTEADAQQYINSTSTYTMITDANGDASLNLTQLGLGDGVYLIIEKKHPAVLNPVAPFYVIMPATSADGARFEYTVNIYPKNEVRGAPGITKDVIELDHDYAEENAYDPQTWIISADIPVDLGVGKKYVISDTLDYRLDYLGNVKVQVESNDGSVVELTLREKTDYYLKVTNVETPVKDGATDAFTVELTASGMASISSWLTPFGSNLPDVDDYKIRVYFDTQINSNAQMGVKIPNQATLDYTNPVGVTYDTARSDIPEVVTGGAKLKKVDAADETQTLAGAEFKLYRKATQEEVADPSVVTVMLNDMVEPMVEVAFFSNPNLTGEKVTSAASGQDGLIYIYGLAYGTYYAVETKAPDGYNLTYKPVEIIINEHSHTEGMEIMVVNKTGTILPTTGGIGTERFFVLGIAIVTIAGSTLLVKRKEHF